MNGKGEGKIIFRFVCIATFISGGLGIVCVDLPKFRSLVIPSCIVGRLFSTTLPNIIQFFVAAITRVCYVKIVIISGSDDSNRDLRRGEKATSLQS